MTDKFDNDSNERRLADIVRDVKIAAADRTDVVVDLRDADKARLELLAQEIRPVFDDIDPADDRFDFGISPGIQPRLWVDAVAHVHMGRDRRMFRFVRDTRLGREVISETHDMAATADAVARYIAERVIERERVLSGDFEAMRLQKETAATVRDDGSKGPAAAVATVPMAEQAKVEKPAVADMAPVKLADTPAKPQSRALDDRRGESRKGDDSGSGLGVTWFVLGCLAGGAALVFAFWDRLSPFLN